MGIRGLLPLVRKQCASSIRELYLSQLKKTAHNGKPITIAVDFNQILFHIMYTYNKHNIKEELHLYVVRKINCMIEKFKKYNILLIFVMDGIPSEDKKATITKRKDKVAKNISKYNQMDPDEQEQLQFKRRTTHITYDDCNQIEQFFQKNGIPYIHHDKYEADLICKWLVEYDIADYAMSNDTDLLAYGCKHIIMDVNLLENTCTYVNYEKVLDGIGLTQHQFLDLCISCGSDYNTRFTSTQIVYQLLKLCKNNSQEPLYTNLLEMIADIDNIKATSLKTINIQIEHLNPPSVLDYKKVYGIFRYHLERDDIIAFLAAGRIYLSKHTTAPADSDTASDTSGDTSGDTSLDSLLSIEPAEDTY